uniref:Uncharacterized protein n=1 Tax=Anguilla anguilla TaxID=7936 RepID=A0A0E9TDW3_ANGAN
MSRNVCLYPVALCKGHHVSWRQRPALPWEHGKF